MDEGLAVGFRETGNGRQRDVQIFMGQFAGFVGRFDAGGTFEAPHNFAHLHGSLGGLEKCFTFYLTIISVHDDKEGRGAKIITVLGRGRTAQHCDDYVFIEERTHAAQSAIPHVFCQGLNPDLLSPCSTHDPIMS